MVIAPGKDGITAFVILADGEFLPQNLNSEKIVVMRRGDSTSQELMIEKPFGEMARQSLLKPAEKAVCNFSESCEAGNQRADNPLHQHEDKTWWFYDETWAYENGPFSSVEIADAALLDYCREVLNAQKSTEEEIR